VHGHGQFVFVQYECMSLCVCVFDRSSVFACARVFVRLRVRVRVCCEVSAGIGQEFHAQVGGERFYTYKRNVAHISHSDIDGSCHI